MRRFSRFNSKKGWSNEGGIQNEAMGGPGGGGDVRAGVIGIGGPGPGRGGADGDPHAFLSLHPTKYGEELVKKMEKTGAKAYLVNTGWNGTGKRISIKDTRGIIDAILDGSIDKAPTKVMPYFDFVVPTELPGVDPKILDPRDTYECACQWEEKAKDLAGRFIKNFAKFTGNEAGKALVAAGPKL